MCFFFFTKLSRFRTQHFASEDAGKGGIALRLKNFRRALESEINFSPNFHSANFSATRKKRNLIYSLSKLLSSSELRFNV